MIFELRNYISLLTMVHQMSTLLSEDSIQQDIYDNDLSYLHELEQLDLLDELCARNNASDNNWFDGMHDLRASERRKERWLHI